MVSQASRDLALHADAPRRNSSKALDKETSLRLRYRVLGDYLPLPSCSERVRMTEVERAKKSFSAIQQDTATFHAIVQHLGLTSMRDFGVDEQFLIYREYERLNAVQLEPAGDMVSYRISDVHEPNCASLAGYPSSGSIDAKGNVIFQDIGRPIVGVSGTTVSRPQASPSRDQEKLDHPELRYMLLQHFGDSISCGPHFVSAATQAAELARFPAVRQDSVAFQLLLQRLGLAAVKEFSHAQQVLVIREYSKLVRIQLEPLEQKIQFKMLIRDPKHAFRGSILFNVDGLIDPRGDITELKRAPSPTSPCPK
jgi:hypothetical protein